MTTPTSLSHCLDASIQEKGGRIELETPAGRLSMSLPPGLSDGQTLRLAGQGEVGPDGKRGDVLLTVSFFTIAETPSSPITRGDLPSTDSSAPLISCAPEVATESDSGPLPSAMESSELPPRDSKPWMPELITDPAIIAAMTERTYRLDGPPEECPSCEFTPCQPVPVSQFSLSFIFVWPLECPKCGTAYHPQHSPVKMAVVALLGLALVAGWYYCTFVNQEVVPSVVRFVMLPLGSCLAYMFGRGFFEPKVKDVLRFRTIPYETKIP